MYGKEIFATDEALTGYEINNVKGIYRCNSSTEFIDSIKKASLHISALKYSENIHTLFNEKYDTQIITEKFKCFIDEHLWLHTYYFIMKLPAAKMREIYSERLN